MQRWVFPEYVAGLGDATCEVQAQKRYIEELEAQGGVLAHDRGRMEGLAATLYGEASRMHHITPRRSPK